MLELSGCEEGMLAYCEESESASDEEGLKYALRLLAMYFLGKVSAQALQSSSEVELDARKAY